MIECELLTSRVTSGILLNLPEPQQSNLYEEKFYCIETFWGEQGRPPKLVQNLLKGERKAHWFRVFIVVKVWS